PHRRRPTGRGRRPRAAQADPRPGPARLAEGALRLRGGPGRPRCAADHRPAGRTGRGDRCRRRRPGGGRGRARPRGPHRCAGARRPRRTRRRRGRGQPPLARAVRRGAAGGRPDAGGLRRPPPPPARRTRRRRLQDRPVRAAGRPRPPRGPLPAAGRVLRAGGRPGHRRTGRRGGVRLPHARGPGGAAPAGPGHRGRRGAAPRSRGRRRTGRHVTAGRRPPTGPPSAAPAAPGPRVGGLPSPGVTRSAVADALARVVAALPGGGEARPGQVEMATAVADAVASGRHLVVRAGTGTGKTLGYLVPTILAGKRGVVATATRALQDQLATKDLPFLERHLGRRFRWAVLKGRANYVCVQRLAELVPDDGGGPDGSPVAAPRRSGGRPRPADQLRLDGLAERADAEELAAIAAWAATTRTGDRSELEVEPREATWA